MANNLETVSLSCAGRKTRGFSRAKGVEKRTQGARLPHIPLQPAGQDTLDDVESETNIKNCDLQAWDPRWRVRLQVAERLETLPDGMFIRVAAVLAEDSHFDVRTAAQRALDRRQRGCRTNVRNYSQAMAEEFDLFERMYGQAAVRCVRELVNRSFDTCVGAVVHNLRGLITPARNDTDALLAKLKTKPPSAATLQKHLARIQGSLQDTVRLIEEARLYSLASSGPRRQERVSQLIASALDNVRATFQLPEQAPDRVHVNVNIPDNVAVKVAKVQLVVALTNVLQNAFEAFPRDWTGSCQINVGAIVVDEAVVLTIRDNGIGFGADELRQIRLFLPGKTTLKHHGTGFGLPTAHRYVEAHGGTLSIDSQLNQGTQVQIRLPLSDWEEESV